MASERLALGQGVETTDNFLLDLKSIFCFIRKVAAAPFKGQASQVIAGSFLFHYKVFNELHDRSLALSRRAFFLSIRSPAFGPLLH